MKYTVKTAFKDKENDLTVRNVGDVIDVTKKRAKEIMDKLGTDALEEVKEEVKADE